MDLTKRTSITDSLQYLTDSISFTPSQRHNSLGSPTNSESGESSLVSPIKPSFFSQVCYRNEIEITGNFIAQFLYGKLPRLRVNNWISKIQRHLFTAMPQPTDNNFKPFYISISSLPNLNSPFLMQAAESEFLDYGKDILPFLPSSVEIRILPGKVHAMYGDGQNRPQTPIEIYNQRVEYSFDRAMPLEEKRSSGPIFTAEQFSQMKFGSLKSRQRNKNGAGFQKMDIFDESKAFY